MLAILASSAAAAKPAPAHGGRIAPAPCASAKTLQKRVSCLVLAVRWERKVRRHVTSVRMMPSVELGYRLAEGLYHVDLRRLGYCESRNNPFDRLGQYRGITQQGYGFEARNRDVYRLLPVWNAVANILVAARHIARAGDGEWQCALDGHVRHGGAYS